MHFAQSFNSGRRQAIHCHIRWHRQREGVKLHGVDQVTDRWINLAWRALWAIHPHAYVERGGAGQITSLQKGFFLLTKLLNCRAGF